MRECTKCRRPVSVRERDMVTGLCPSCRQVEAEEIAEFEAGGRESLRRLSLAYRHCWSRSGLLSLDDRPWGKYVEPRWYSRDSRVRLFQRREYRFRTTGFLHRRYVLVDVKSGQTVRTAESRPSWRILSDAWNVELGVKSASLSTTGSAAHYFVRYDNRIIATVHEEASFFRCSTRWCVHGKNDLNDVDLLFIALGCRRSRGPLLSGNGGGG